MKRALVVGLGLLLILLSPLLIILMTFINIYEDYIRFTSTLNPAGVHIIFLFYFPRFTPGAIHILALRAIKINILIVFYIL